MPEQPQGPSERVEKASAKPEQLFTKEELAPAPTEEFKPMPHEQIFAAIDNKGPFVLQHKPGGKKSSTLDTPVISAR